VVKISGKKCPLPTSYIILQILTIALKEKRERERERERERGDSCIKEA